MCCSHLWICNLGPLWMQYLYIQLLIFNGPKLFLIARCSRNIVFIFCIPILTCARWVRSKCNIHILKWRFSTDPITVCIYIQHMNNLCVVWHVLMVHIQSKYFFLRTQCQHNVQKLVTRYNTNSANFHFVKNY